MSGKQGVVSARYWAVLGGLKVWPYVFSTLEGCEWPD